MSTTTATDPENQSNAKASTISDATKTLIYINLVIYLDAKAT